MYRTQSSVDERKVVFLPRKSFFNPFAWVKKLVFFIRIFLWENITKKFQWHNTLRHGGYLLSKDQENSLAFFRENKNFNFCFFYPIWLHLCCWSEKLISYRLTWILGHIWKHLSTYGYKCSCFFKMKKEKLYHVILSSWQKYCCLRGHVLLTLIEPVYDIFVLGFRPKKQQFMVASPRP